MNNKNFQNEEEILSGEDLQLRQMLGDLEKIEAPKDFDFRLKARIAAADAKDFQPRSLAFLRVAAPLGLILVVLAFLVLGGLFSVDDNTVPAVAVDSKPEVIKQADPPVTDAVDLIADEADPEKAGIANPDVKSDETSNRRPQIDGGGSRDSAVTDPNKLNPPGLDPNKPLEKPNDFKNTSPHGVKEMLSILGIDADLSREGWKVRRVAPDSTAERSGVRVNDVVKAIDKTEISGETIPTSSVEAKKLTVVRDGKRKEIALQ